MPAVTQDVVTSLDAMSAVNALVHVDEIYHLYVTDRKTIPDLNTPQYHQFNDRSSATWTSDDQIYILSTEGEPKDLASLL